MIVDARNPADPKTAGMMAPPLEGNPQESSRELRVWRSQEILIVLHTNCGGATAHLCQQPNRSSMKFYDISGDNATNPQLLLPEHARHARVLHLGGPEEPEARADVRGHRGRQLRHLRHLAAAERGPGHARARAACSSGTHGFAAPPQSGSGIHSFSVSNDGKRAYFALLTRGFGVTDVSDFTDTDPATNTYRLVTPSANRVTWPGPGAHSAIKLWNKDGSTSPTRSTARSTGAGHGCPWGWTRFIDIKDETRPAVVEEYRLPENEPLSCATFNPPRTSYSAHNPTLTPNIAFSTWHSGGLQAMDISDPTNVDPARRVQARAAGRRWTSRTRGCPTTASCPAAATTGRDVELPGDPGRADLRPSTCATASTSSSTTARTQQEVADIKFLEGNSNQGDALCFEPVPGAVLGGLLDVDGRRRGRHRAGHAVADHGARGGLVRRVHAGRGEGLLRRPPRRR